MKYTIHGFNQKEAIKMGLSNDDLLFLRWFIDFKDSEDMERKYITEINNMGYWCSYRKISEDLPIIFCGSKTANNKKIQRMLNGALSKVITRKFEVGKNKEGGRVYLAIIAKEYSKLIKSNEDKKEDKKIWTKMSIGCGQECPEGMDKNVHTDISIKDKSINNNNIPSFYSNNINNIEQKNYCNVEQKEEIERKIDEIIEYTLGAYNKYQCMEFLNASKGDVELVKYCYDKVLEKMKDENCKPIKSLERYILGTIKREIKNFYSKRE